MILKPLLRGVFCLMLLGLPGVIGCGDSEPASKTAPEPNIGPAAIPGGGAAETPKTKTGP